MALFGVSITKDTTFRDGRQEFSNVYHYTYTGLNPSVVLAEQIIDRLVTLEKVIHSTAVSFKFARLWSAGGSISQNAMIFQKALTGAGSAAVSSGFDKERAYLFSWPAGLSAIGKPVRARKWYHTCGIFPGGTVGSTILDNTTSWTQAQRDSMEAFVDPFHPLLVNAQSMDMTTDSARGVSYGAESHKYLEHHQLGDQWRG